MTLVALSVRFLEERGVKADTGMLSRFFWSEGISFKKSVLPSEQDRPDVARQRKSWKRYQGKVDPRRLVFIEPPRDCRRLQLLRGWSYDKENIGKIFT